MKISNYVRGIVFSLLSVLSFSSLETLGYFGLSAGASPVTILVIRSITAIILFGITIFFWNRELFKVKKEDIKWLVLMGLIMFVEILSYWYAFKLLNKQVAVLVGIYYVAPLWTALLYIIFAKRKFTKNVYLAIFLAILGSLLILGLIPNFILTFSLLGILCTILSSITWAILFITSQRVIKNCHPVTILFYSLILVLFGSLIIQNPSTTISQLNPETLKYSIILGILSTFSAYIFLQLAIKYNQAMKSSIFDVANVAGSIIISFLVLGQLIGWLQGLGIVLIMFNFYLLREKNA
jgi:drug/metabolite transporter (DMT)-like permease